MTTNLSVDATSSTHNHNLEKKKTLRQRSVRGGTVLFGTQIGTSVIRICGTAVLARLLVPADFGLLAMVTALTVFAERFKDLGLGDATVQAKEIDNDQISNLFWLNLSVCIAIGLTIAILSRPIAWFYNEPRLSKISVAIACTFFFSGLVIQHEALLRRNLRFEAIGLIQFCSVVLSLIVAILFAYNGFGYWALVLREVARGIFIAIGTWTVCRWQPTLPKRGVSVKQFLQFGRDVTGFNLVYFLSRSFDRIILGKLQGPHSVGIYSNSHQLVTLPVNQIQEPINLVALSGLSTFQADPLAFKGYYESMVKLLSFVCMPIVVLLGVFADQVVALLLGPKWTSAVPIFRILAVGAFIAPIAHSVGPAIVALGKTKKYFRLGIINALSLLSCIGVGIIWGTLGVAAGYSLSMYLSLVAGLAYGLKDTPIAIRYLSKIVATNCSCSLPMGGIIILLRFSLGWKILPQEFILLVIAGVIVYLGVWLIVPGGREMLKNYWDFAKQANPWSRS